MNLYSLTKTAEKYTMDIERESDYQKGWEDYFGDIQRTGSDQYQSRCYLTETENKVTVTLNINHGMFGTTVFQQYWRFEKNELKQAKQTFELVKNATKEIMERFRHDETPNVLLHSVIREAVMGMDREHAAKSGIPYINYVNQRETYSGDWRSQIYGTRYPHSDGF